MPNTLSLGGGGGGGGGGGALYLLRQVCNKESDLVRHKFCCPVRAEEYRLYKIDLLIAHLFLFFFNLGFLTTVHQLLTQCKHFIT